MTMHLRDLTTIEDFRDVVAMEREVWGFDPGEDAVPVALLAVTVKRGGILIGAFEGDRMVGFVYSLAAMREGLPTQWSHMLAVLQSHRGDGTGRLLKLEQRQRALDLGLDLIEWTFDPLQAVNAHLNFRKLGIVVEEYEENIYGETSSRLHGRMPTDRMVAQWWIRRPHVERRIGTTGPLVRTSEITEAPVVNPTRELGRWRVCDQFDLSHTERRLFVEIPLGFTEMIAEDAARAAAWRMATREIFQHYFSRGYRAVDFFLNPSARRGAYLLALED